MNSKVRHIIYGIISFVLSFTVFDFVCNSSSVNNPQPIVYYG